MLMGVNALKVAIGVQAVLADAVEVRACRGAQRAGSGNNQPPSNPCLRDCATGRRTERECELHPTPCPDALPQVN